MPLTSEKYADAEIPSGSINGVNKIFTLDFSPTPTTSLEIYKNGFLSSPTEDYTLSGNTVTFIIAPIVNTILIMFYRYT